MEKTSCTEKVCKRCGWCCTSLGKDIGLNPEEDEKLRKLVFERSGVVYLRSLNKYFLAMMPETAEKLKHHAKKLGFKADIKPNKLIYDKAKDKVFVYDYYLDNEQCPFYDLKNQDCLVYEDRPSACRKFPNIDNSYAVEVKDFVKRNNIPFEGLSYKEALEKCEEFLEK